MTKNLYTTSRWAAYLVCMVFLLSRSILSPAQIIITCAGNGIDATGGDNGQATAASIREPSSLTVDASGNLYISDLLANRVRKVNVAGVISTFAGTGVAGYAGDNGPATAAKLRSNWGLATQYGNYLLISDLNNFSVRRVSPTNIISTIAGTGVYAYSGDGGPASSAQLQAPKGIATDGAGNVYVSGDSKVRKINTSGVISLFAGYGLSGPTYGYSGDGGPATLAQLSNIFGMATDGAGNVYICDADNNVIRKVNTSGIITTIAGNGTAGYGGDGGQATAAMLRHPLGVFVSSSGEIYIADHDNNRVRKVTTAGIISTVAGTGVPGFSGDNGPATAAQLDHPISVTIDASDNIYVADQKNFRVRKIVKSVAFTGSPSQNLNVCKNSGPTPINNLLKVQDYSAGLTDTWTIFAAPGHGIVSGSYSTTSTGGVLTPAGLYYTPNVGYSGSDNFKVKVSNSSASDIITINVSINPLTLSAGTIGIDSSVCLGAAITLSSTVTGGAWSSTNNNAVETPVAGGKLMVTGAVAPGIDTIWYTVSNACGTASTRLAVSVNPIPAPGIISGAGGVCVNQTTTLGVSVPGGTWSASNLSTVSYIPIPGGSVIRGVSPGTVMMQYAVWNTWCPAITSHILKVETFPHADAITGPSSVCVGSVVTLEDAIGSGSWSNGNAESVSVTPIVKPNFGQSIVKGVSAGASTITYTITNSCGTDFVSKDITVHPLPELPDITREDALLSVPSDYSAYQWVADGRNIPGAVYDTCSVNGDGDYAVLVSNSYGCSALSAPYKFSGCDPAELDVFPNPTFSKVYVNWCKGVNARIVAADGRTVGVVLSVKEIDLGALPQGSYVISFFDSKGNKVKSQKVEKLAR
jgi:hypothetical protein